MLTPFKLGNDQAKKSLSSLCKNQRKWLVSYAGLSKSKVAKLNCAQVAEAVKLIKIRDGL